jgi:hypothetical protein
MSQENVLDKFFKIAKLSNCNFPSMTGHPKNYLGAFE